MAEYEGVACTNAELFIIFVIQQTLFDQIHLFLSQRTVGRIEENEVIPDYLFTDIANVDPHIIE